MRVGGECRGRDIGVGSDDTDVDAFVDRLEQARERVGRERHDHAAVSKSAAIVSRERMGNLSICL